MRANELCIIYNFICIGSFLKIIFPINAKKTKQTNRHNNFLNGVI